MRSVIRSFMLLLILGSAAYCRESSRTTPGEPWGTPVEGLRCAIRLAGGECYP